jgi:hypothetical protein
VAPGELASAAKSTRYRVSRRPDPEYGFEADAKVGAEIVEHEVNAPGFRVDMFEQVFDEGDEVDFGPVSATACSSHRCTRPAPDAGTVGHTGRASYTMHHISLRHGLRQFFLAAGE